LGVCREAGSFEGRRLSLGQPSTESSVTRTSHHIQQSLRITQLQYERIVCVEPAPPLSSKNVERINNKDDIRHTAMFVDAVSVISMHLKFVQLLEPSVQRRIDQLHTSQKVVIQYKCVNRANQS